MSDVNPFLLVGFFGCCLLILIAVIFAFLSKDSFKVILAIALGLVSFVLAVIFAEAASEQWSKIHPIPQSEKSQ